MCALLNGNTINESMHAHSNMKLKLLKHGHCSMHGVKLWLQGTLLTEMCEQNNSDERGIIIITIIIIIKKQRL